MRLRGITENHRNYCSLQAEYYTKTRIDIHHLCRLQFKSIKVKLPEDLSLHVSVSALKPSKTPNLYQEKLLRSMGQQGQKLQSRATFHSGQEKQQDALETSFVLQNCIQKLGLCRFPCGCLRSSPRKTGQNVNFSQDSSVLAARARSRLLEH